jgi:hypothetical protein
MLKFLTGGKPRPPKPKTDDKRKTQDKEYEKKRVRKSDFENEMTEGEVDKFMRDLDSHYD